MKGYMITSLPSGIRKCSSSSHENSKRIISLILSFVIASTVIVFFCTSNFFNSSSPDLKFVYRRSSSRPTIQEDHNLTSKKKIVQKCNLFSGNWIIPADQVFDGHRWPYYTNSTKCPIDDRQNCMKFGRPDTEFLRWRWKPDDCDLPLFDGTLFLKLVKGKSMAFIGDSLARNQMQSLVCLLASVAEPLDISEVQDTRFRRWFYREYNFTLAALWSTHLVRSEDADTKFHSLTSLMNLYLDEVDKAWATKIELFDYLIISSGQWFLRPLIYYEKRKMVGCYSCNTQNNHNLTELGRNYGHRMAFRTTLRSLVSNKRFKGITFVRTFSPQHYENGEWNKGGNCLRKIPLSKEEVRMDEYYWEMYLNQVQELRSVEIKGKKRGLKFKLLDATEMMSVRADGHPNYYGRHPNGNISIADCVHWCLPGPIDTWNEILLQLLS